MTLKHKYSFLPSTLACALLVFCNGCTHFIEWRGGLLPTLVWNKYGPDVPRHREQRKADSANVSGTSPMVPSSGKPHWPAFRGPRGDGIYTEQSILTDWPEEGPPVLWRKLVGGGHSSFAIANDLAFTIEQQEGNEVVAAFSTKTGVAKWTHPYTAKFRGIFGGIGPRTTPTWDEGLLYTLGAKGHLHCLDAGSGKLRWKKNLMTENKVEMPHWGISASPLIYKNTAIITPGGEADNAIIALNKKTGEKA